MFSVGYEHNMAQPDGCTPICEINALFDVRGHTQLKQPTDTQQTYTVYVESEVITRSQSSAPRHFFSVCW